VVDVTLWINVAALALSVFAIEISSAVHRAIKKRDRDLHAIIDHLTAENKKLREKLGDLE